MFAKVKKFVAEHRKAFVGVAAVALTIAVQSFPESQYTQFAVLVAAFFGIKAIRNQAQS